MVGVPSGEQYELVTQSSQPAMEAVHEEPEHESLEDQRLHRRTLRKLDFVLLPFLSLLFLLNSLDKSNIGNAETAGFTHDAGLSAQDLNISLAFFFAFFVALQPLGAALGRRYGMARWVPACMTLWGLSTILHIWVRRRWQLILLRVIIATLEAGFYPTTVSYLSLFYTRYEFAVRLGIFYGQTAVAGALGGVLSWAVFSHFPSRPGAPGLLPPESSNAIESIGWKSWEVLFLIEGCMTMVVAFVGFFWLPHSADTAWFFNASERRWAEQRIRLDRDAAAHASASPTRRRSSPVTEQTTPSHDFNQDDEHDGEAHDRLLSSTDDTHVRHRKLSVVSATSVTADAGLSRHDIVSAVIQRKIWHLLICNILSAIPATAFGVFLPLVMKQLSPALDLTPAQSNLLAAPPFACGAVALFIFTRWSDRSHQRLLPILWSLGLLLIGLTLTVLSPMSNYILRYSSLCILLSGSYIASPLTVAWLTNNTPEPGKRAILLGINGWGNLAGVFSALLFTPADEKTGYVKPFVITLLCVMASFAGFAAFRAMLQRENRSRQTLLASWDEVTREREELMGDAYLDSRSRGLLARIFGDSTVLKWLGADGHRRGDEKLTFLYSL
ncbi:hypothetical protein B0A48_16644 [Cryoendolithus antarcticus]|uniref:Major facilitator superfamily (MFS) profile domain-containing protein n=1 Tax=Cryoendolithus antarcticus TaxID=1507870 RepID=A0A1V8SF81_9PEZI|nr:hypothetical protein B0A48_16644 [Cryoendolithus antarcticus]